MVAPDSFSKIVTDKGLSRLLEIPSPSPTVQQIGVPEKNIAFPGLEELGLESILLYEFGHGRLVAALVDIVLLFLKFPTFDSNIIGEEIGESMGAGIVFQQTAIGSQVLECNPGSREVPGRICSHVDRVGVGRLLSTFMSCDGLEGTCLPTEDHVGNVKQLAVL